MNDDNNNSKRSELARLLEARMVTGVDVLVGGMLDEELGPGLTAVAMWDAMPEGKKSTGLLVWFLRNPSSVPAAKPGSKGISPTLEKAIRGSCRSPNGFTRDMARDMLRGKAEKLGMLVDSLIDAVMGPEWQETPPDARHDPEAPREERLADQLRYERERA